MVTISSASSIFLVFITTSVRGNSELRGPPHVTNEMLLTYRAKIGDTIKIDCPIDSGPSLPVYYEWKKDEETITSAWDRFRVTPRKLRIKGVLAEDGGVYKCKGTNGFGSKELSTRLLVEDENGKVVGGTQEESDGEKITAPPFGSTFRPKVGSTLTLRCKVDGHPLPTVVWFRIRDEIQLPRATSEELELRDLEYDDSGVYFCVASNVYGQINASFIVEVLENGMEGPRIISLESSNVTAVKGQLIHFRCLISSDTLPNVQWLRQLGAEELDSDAGLQMAGVRYKVISTGSRVTAFQNGTYVSELSLRMEGRIAGIVCLATNSGGFKFETTTVALRTEIGESDPVLPMAMVIAIPVTLLFLIFSMALIFCCIRRGRGGSQSPGTVTTSTTYATPRDATGNDYQPPPLPFYNPRQQSYQPNYPQHRTLTNGTSGTCPVSQFGSQPYFGKGNLSGSPVKHHYQPQYHSSSPAYASVPICELQGTGSTSNTGMSRAPPLPSRTFPNPSLRGDRNSFNSQGLLTQPLLTQTGSSSDSRDSRQSGGNCQRGITEFVPNSQTGQKQTIDHWCMSSGGSEGSWDRKNQRAHHQIRV